MKPIYEPRGAAKEYGDYALNLYGDAQIDGAIADGMARALPQEHIEVVQAEIDRQHIQRSLVRVAVGNTKSNSDYDCMTTYARYRYRQKEHGPLYKTSWGIVGLICVIVAEVYDYLSGINREG